MSRYLFLLLLAGCSTTYQIPPGRTQAEFDRDAYDCERDAAVVREAGQANAMVDRCLRSKGWRPAQ